jgi:NitT/TauT family transport system permease protein
MMREIEAGRVRQALPSLAAMTLLIASWWLLVVATGSAIFPTPWQVVTGTLELIADGTLWPSPSRSRSASGWAGCAARTRR